MVEAYWIGNELLDGVEVRQLYDALLERFGKQLQGRTRELVLGKAPAGARPHHSFHVLDVHSRVGELEHTLATLDNCRVSWGKVRRVEGAELVVERQPLDPARRQARARRPRAHERVVRQVDGRGFADDAPAGRLGLPPLGLGLRGAQRAPAPQPRALHPAPPGSPTRRV